MNHPLCLWTQAGVVNRKRCKIEFNCPECRFDMKMRNLAQENMRLRKNGKIPEGEKGQIIYWKDKLRSLPIAKRPCVHHMKGKIEFRICIHDYHCVNCDFDQFFYDQYTVHAVINPVDFSHIHGFKIPQGYYFHQGHTWAKIEEGSSVRVGIDDFALRLFGPFDNVEAPLIGKEVKQGIRGINIFREGKNAELLSPVSGIVTSTNPRHIGSGSLSNEDPYSKGWVFRVETNRLRQDLKSLMISQETEDFFKDQVEQLHQMIEDVSGPFSIDGGNFGHDIYGKMPELSWEELVRRFLQVHE